MLTQVQEFLLQSFAAGTEGLMVKRLDGNAAYQPSKRSESWIKIKRQAVCGNQMHPVSGNKGSMQALRQGIQVTIDVQTQVQPAHLPALLLKWDRPCHVDAPGCDLNPGSCLSEVYDLSQYSLDAQSLSLAAWVVRMVHSTSVAQE